MSTENNFPTLTLADVQDWSEAGLDSTGRMRNDNPLRNWDCHELSREEYDNPPDWLIINEINGDDKWVFVRMNDTQYLAFGPPIFLTAHALALITYDGEAYEVEIYVGSL